MTNNPPAPLTSRLGLCLCVVSILSVIIRVGWIIPCMIFGVLLGMELAPRPMSATTAETRMMGFIISIGLGAIYGGAIGLLIDMAKRNRDTGER